MGDHIRLGMVGGGKNAFIGGVRRIAARIDAEFDRLNSTRVVRPGDRLPEQYAGRAAMYLGYAGPTGQQCCAVGKLIAVLGERAGPGSGAPG